MENLANYKKKILGKLISESLQKNSELFSSLLHNNFDNFVQKINELKIIYDNISLEIDDNLRFENTLDIINKNKMWLSEEEILATSNITDDELKEVFIIEEKIKNLYSDIVNTISNNNYKGCYTSESIIFGDYHNVNKKEVQDILDDKNLDKRLKKEILRIINNKYNSYSLNYYIPRKIIDNTSFSIPENTIEYQELINLIKNYNALTSKI